MNKRILAAAASAAAAVLITVGAAGAAPANVGNPAFARVWDRQDLAMEQQVSGRSWTWGPTVSAATRESFAEGVDGQRVVQYFDKSRMEINDPTGDPNTAWYVTNGLLPVELMTGRMQTGYSRFEFHGPAPITAIGDPGQFPTYADLLPLYQVPGTSGPNPGDVGKPATGFLNPGGNVSGFNDFASDPATVLNEQGVACAFVDFENNQGLVYENGRYAQKEVFDPLYVFGKPVTGAYWVKVKVGGVERPILFQVFERRVLTYNPANDVAFRVEMGNVGQHYHQWRYGK